MNLVRARRAVLLAAGTAFAAVLAAPFAVRAADEPKAAAPVLCVVRGDKIADPSKAPGKAEINGKTYYMCCAGCVSKFNKSDDAAKAKFAKITDLKTEKAVLEGRLKSIDAELGTLEGKKPAAAPVTAPVAAAASAAPLQCAVTGEEIASVADAAGGKTEFNGKTYYFCCPGCKTKFDGDKTKFAAEADKRKAGI